MTDQTQPANNRHDHQDDRRHQDDLLTLAEVAVILRTPKAAHTAASLAIAAGANVKVIQQMLGHKSATMTLDQYGHLFGDQLDQVAEALNTASLAARLQPAAPAPQSGRVVPSPARANVPRARSRFPAVQPRRPGRGLNRFEQRLRLSTDRCGTRNSCGLGAD